MTPATLLRETSLCFRKAGIPDPETDSALLLSFLTGVKPLPLRLDTDTELSPDILSAFSALVTRRLSREPLQYITGEAPFFGRFFAVTPDVLIPRPETEELCSWALEILPASGAAVLDLCCGSGCIGLTLAAERPSLQITLSDISSRALDVASVNCSRLKTEVFFHQGDLTEGLPSHYFDCIISNPPYIPSDECGNLQPEVLCEPLVALDGGTDGLSFYRRIADETPRVLKKGGTLLLEIGFGETDAVSSVLASAGFSDLSVRNDFSGIPRMMYAKYLGGAYV